MHVITFDFNIIFYIDQIKRKGDEEKKMRGRGCFQCLVGCKRRGGKENEGILFLCRFTVSLFLFIQIYNKKKKEIID